MKKQSDLDCFSVYAGVCPQSCPHPAGYGLHLWTTPSASRQGLQPRRGDLQRIDPAQLHSAIMLIFCTISSISLRATGKYSKLYNLLSSNSGFHRFQNLFGGISLIRQLSFSLGFLQLEIYLAIKLQVFKCLVHRNISLSSMTEKILRKSGGFKLSTQPLIYRILVSGKLSSMSILATRGGNVKPF